MALTPEARPSTALSAGTRPSTTLTGEARPTTTLTAEARVYSKKWSDFTTETWASIGLVRWEDNFQAKEATQTTPLTSEARP